MPTIDYNPLLSQTVTSSAYTIGTITGPGLTTTGTYVYPYPQPWTVAPNTSPGTALAPWTIDSKSIKHNGENLNEILKKIMDFIGIIKQNPELESKYSELKELGDKYRALEKDLLEKDSLIEALKS